MKLLKNKIEEFRSKFLGLSNEVLYKEIPQTLIEKQLSEGYKLIKIFLKNNPDLLVKKADKGNITVVISRNAYSQKMFEIFDDRDSFEIIEDNRTKKLQKATFGILEKFRVKVYLRKMFQW